MTINDLLNGKKSVKLGTLKIKNSNDEFTITIIPDTSALSAYGIKLSNGKNSQGIRMQYKARMQISEVVKHLEEYLNTNESEKIYIVELDCKQTKSKQATIKEIDPLKEELKKLKGIRFKTAQQEKQIDRLEKLIKLNPNKWQVGYGVAWKVTGNQINRSYQIAEIDYQNKKAVIKPVADTGLTIDGSDRMPIEWHTVSMVDLIRDKKYDKVS